MTIGSGILELQAVLTRLDHATMCLHSFTVHRDSVSILRDGKLQYYLTDDDSIGVALTQMQIDAGLLRKEALRDG